MAIQPPEKVSAVVQHNRLSIQPIGRQYIGRQGCRQRRRIDRQDAIQDIGDDLSRALADVIHTVMRTNNVLQVRSEDGQFLDDLRSPEGTRREL